MRVGNRMVNKVHYTWKDIEHMLNTINNLMFADNWRPDYIVGLTRGGLVPAVMMSNMTGIMMHALDVRFRDTDSNYSGPESNTWMAEDALQQGKKILIIDDINDSGKTLSWIRDDWQASMGGSSYDASAWGDTVRTACLIDNGASGFDGMDYTPLEINKMENDVWVVFPWEGERDYGKL